MGAAGSKRKKKRAVEGWVGWRKIEKKENLDRSSESLGKSENTSCMPGA